jgi:AcrR family transcriptional regulator
MARTLDPEAHALRRDAFVDAALQLIQTKGYEQMSVQDVLAALDSSRGAFYHYFDSKTALLEAVVERIVDVVVDALGPIAADPTLSAPEKLQHVFAGIGRWKTARRELMEHLIETWLSDENAIVRARFRQRVLARFTPFLASILEAGNAEGTITAEPAGPVAVVLVSMILGANETASRLYVANHAGDAPLDQVLETFDAYARAFERVLGLPAGSWTSLDPALLRQWFA